MNISADQLAEQVSRARARGWTPVMRKAEKRYKLPAALLLALASRETDMNDIVGDKGHGRGLFQIDDRFHAVVASLPPEECGEQGHATDESDQQSVPNWTSMRHVALLVRIEKVFGTRFSNAEIGSVHVVAAGSRIYAPCRRFVRDDGN